MFGLFQTFEDALKHLNEEISKTPQKEIVFPSCFDITIKLKKVLDRDDYALSEVTDLLKADPVISAKIVSAANSVVYYKLSPSSSVDHAVSRIGVQAAKNIAVVTAMAQYFNSKELQAFQSLSSKIWKHSVYSAVACKHLSAIYKIGTPEDAFFLGLIHDIGAFYFLSRAAKYKPFVENLEETTKVAIAWHAGLTVLVLYLYDIPLDSIAAIKAVDRPKSIDEIKMETIADVLYMGNALASKGMPWEESEKHHYDVPQEYLDRMTAIDLLFKKNMELYQK